MLRLAVSEARWLQIYNGYKAVGIFNWYCGVRCYLSSSSTHRGLCGRRVCLVWHAVIPPIYIITTPVVSALKSFCAWVFLKAQWIFMITMILQDPSGSFRPLLHMADLEAKRVCIYNGRST